MALGAAYPGASVYPRNFMQLFGTNGDKLLDTIDSVVVGLNADFSLTVKIYDCNRMPSSVFIYESYIKAKGKNPVTRCKQ